MGETDLERKQRPDADHTSRRAQSARTASLHRSAARIVELDTRMATAAGGPHRVPSDRFRALGHRWTAEKGALLRELAQSPDVADDTREAWHAALSAVTLTDDDGSRLVPLLDAVRVRAVAVALTGSPGAWRRLSAMVDRLAGLVEVHAAARAEALASPRPGRVAAAE